MFRWEQEQGVHVGLKGESRQRIDADAGLLEQVLQQVVGELGEVVDSFHNAAPGSRLPACANAPVGTPASAVFRLDLALGTNVPGWVGFSWRGIAGGRKPGAFNWRGVGGRRKPGAGSRIQKDTHRGTRRTLMSFCAATGLPPRVAGL